jgi:beta-xylosidase
MYSDTWKNISINGVQRQDIALDFVTKDSMEYYNIGNNDTLPKKVGVSISGLQNREKIKRGDIRKILVSARIPYTVEQTQSIDDIKYRLYVSEGSAELTVIDFQPVEMASNYYYFLLDTASLIPNMYYLDVLVTSNLEVTTIKNAVQFEIVNQVDLRHGS